MQHRIGWKDLVLFYEFSSFKGVEHLLQVLELKQELPQLRDRKHRWSQAHNRQRRGAKQKVDMGEEPNTKSDPEIGPQAASFSVEDSPSHCCSLHGFLQRCQYINAVFCFAFKGLKGLA